MVGLADKNGTYFAFDGSNVSAGPVWRDQVTVGGSSPQKGNADISSSAWDGSTLYIAGGNTTIGGKTCNGSVRAVNPTNGNYLWQDCLSNPVLGSVSGVPGVIEVGAGPSIILLNASTGKMLFTFTDTMKNSYFWGPGSISDGVLYHGNIDGTFYAFTV
jgi:hypothetical protein